MFTQNFRTFDHLPNDEVLTALLGPRELTNSLEVIDHDHELIIRPRLIPLRFAVPWILLVGCVITALIWFVPATRATFDRNHAVLFTVMMWAMAIPALIGMLAWFNFTFRAHGDYCRIDQRARTLRARFARESIARDEIVFIVDLERFYVRHGVWDAIRQVSALRQTSGGTYEQYPLATQTEKPIFGPDYAALIATALDVPLRRIKSSKAESKAISDHSDD
jgi:hypothetical protein